MHGAETLFSILITAAIFGLGFAAGYGVRAAISRQSSLARAWIGFDRRPRSPAGYAPPAGARLMTEAGRHPGVDADGAAETEGDH